MQPHDDGGAAAAPQENAKRMRRPSVRLHHPYYESPVHRKQLQQQWSAKKGVTLPRRPRSAKTAHSKENRNDAVSERSRGGEAGNHDFDDDVAIGNWRNSDAANRDRDFRRVGIRFPSSRKRVPASHGIGNSPLSSCGEQGQEQEGKELEVEEDLGGDGGINSNLVVENSVSSSPNHSSDEGDNGNHKLSDDDDDNNMGRKPKGLVDNQHLMTMEVDGDSNGVKMWLNDLGLGKYVPLFEIHGVDDEVLPLLTLEDLKDMGITEVGVRRKMYSSIQKLDRWFP